MRLTHRLRPVASLILFWSLAALASGAADLKRVALQQREPDYPEIARRMRVTGSVILEISIEADGHVSSVRPESGHPLLTRAAEDAVRQWKYTAAQAATVTTVHLNFNLPN